MYWLTNSFTNIKYDKTSVHLLPAFDEFLISYKNRKVLFPLENHRKAISENGIFRPVIVINGLVVGLWKRIIKKDKVIIETEFFQPVNNATLSLIKKSADKFGLFLNKEIEVKK